MTQVFLTTASSSPWSKPGDFTAAGHTVELLAAGGNGAAGTTGNSGNGGGGGGSSGYGKFTYSSGTVGSTVKFLLTSGTVNPTGWQNDTNTAPINVVSGGGDASGTGAGSSGIGGATSGTPAITYTITTNSTGAAGGSAGKNTGGAGGGGTGGPAAAGGAGATATTANGSGGGGANNGATGDASGQTGGQGSSGTPGGAGYPATNGTGNSGGGGCNTIVLGASGVGGNGGSGTDFDGTHGCAGAGGGGPGVTGNSPGEASGGGNGGLYGGGGGGTGYLRGSGTQTAGLGQDGLIVITYTAGSSSVSISVPSGNIALSTVAPTIFTALQPTSGNLVLTTVAPTIFRADTIQPTSGNVVLSTVAPTVGIGSPLPILYPDGDISDGSWTTDTGGTTLYAAIDEVTINDADYIQSVLNPTDDICEVSIQNPTGTFAAPYVVRYRYYRTTTGQQIDLTVQLIQTTRVIATWFHTAISTTLVQADQTLSTPEGASITDFSDLRLRFTATTSNATITTAFLARTTGLDATHTAAYKKLINGLVIDGICTDTTWGPFDLLYVFCTQDTTNALLNLPSATYNATVSGSPTFTADRGYTGATSAYLETSLSPAGGGVNFVTNDAMIGAWSLSAAANGAPVMGNSLAFDGMFLRYTDDTVKYNLHNSGTSSSVANTDGSRFFVAQRTASNATELFANGSSFTSDSAAVGTIQNGSMQLLCGPSSNFYTDGPVMFAMVGSHLTSAQQTSLYSRLLAFAQAVGAK